MPRCTDPVRSICCVGIGRISTKIFSGRNGAPAAISAMRAVLPKDAIVAAVGGINPENMAVYMDAGANSFGLGSALFKPSYDMPELKKRAVAFVNAFEALKVR